MEDIAFSDWPGAPVDLNSGSNPWLPAYGFQTPSALLERDDFIGNPDAEYFLQNTSHYMYLETIQEETSDDLRSESDLDSRGSPVGWFGTDSETNSVVCLGPADEYDSDREIACPAKRRKQEILLTVNDEEPSLSRTSSLLVFETLEKQCQETSSSNPSLHSQISFDSLERKSEKKLKKPGNGSKDSLLYNVSRYSGSDSSEADSECTIEAARSLDNLKPWRSFEALPGNGFSLNLNSSTKVKEKISSENLSEDSGYSDHLSKSSKMRSPEDVVKRSFPAYDGEVFQQMNGNFGVSYQDLTAFEKYDPEYRSPLIDRFMRNKKRAVTKALNLESLATCGQAKYTSSSASEPNLLETVSAQPPSYVSVPKDLNLISFESPEVNSIAVKNWNLEDISRVGGDCVDMGSYKREGSYDQAMRNRVDLSDDENSLCYKKKLPKSPIIEFDRKVLKAISEQSIQSLVSSSHSIHDTYLNDLYAAASTPIERRSVASTPNLALTENDIIDCYLKEERRKSGQEFTVRKNSLIKSSTSTSGMSDFEDKTLTSLKSFGSNSKGVHFSPVVSEVNWGESSTASPSPERESTYSIESSPDRDPTPPVFKPKARKPSPAARRLTASQPDLSDTDSCKREFIQSLKTLKSDISKSQSQPDVAKLRRRGSQLMKKDKDGSIISAYVDRDGIQYQHTHLDLNLFKPPPGQAAASEGGGGARKPISPTDENSKPGRFKSVESMEVHDAQRKEGKGRAGKIGGFFSRLASFRFSSRKGADEKAKIKKKLQDGSAKQVVSSQMPAPRLATKEDYIYIPLKGPLGSESQCGGHNNNNSPGAAGKPPLPRQPPRVVHASVKATAHAPRQGESEGRQRRHRRSTIDSGEARPQPMEPMGLIETDLDTEVTVITNAKTRSLLNLGAEPRLSLAAPEPTRHRPHKSMEFLLDKQNLKVVEPPENELQKGERVMSEHQLRVQRSLQKLTVPDWYKQSQVPREGFLLKKQSPRESRWTGTSSKTPSLSSLGSNVQSPLVLSPTPTGQPFVRWSTSKLNSTASSPCASTRSSFNARQPNGSISPSSARSSFNYRQPYLGWRSQERLSRPRTPAERLANTLLSQQQHHQQESPEIQTSIKEVTSAIVHYVSALRPEDNRDKSYESQDTASQRSSSVSPRGSQKFCWLESSFVGTKPLDSPQTPVTLSESQSITPVPPSSLRLDLQAHNDVKLLAAGDNSARPSPGSTTLEDVLDSLLGLPSTGRAPSPSLQETASANTSPSRTGKHTKPSEAFRRRSEGSEPSTAIPSSRRVSFNSSPILRCRYARCGRTAMALSAEAAAFKNCHNCSYIYCSRACRRAHWEKHRKTCLFSRIGTLCRQIIAASKEQKDTLLHLSTIARRGYLSQGPGAVKCYFTCAENAEKFLSFGLQSFGELTYIRWQDLQPSEMGPQLYAELLKMCKNYNPDTKLVLYVSVCVISETPASGAIKWERQLVSRCAKLRLSKDVPIPESNQESPETLILTSEPLRGLEEEVKEMRKTSVNNLQGHLRIRGVSVRRQHPEIYRQLNNYCDNSSEKFTPVTVYPTDSVSGKSFMCIIMLEADGESLRQVETAGVRVRTIDVLNQPVPI